MQWTDLLHTTYFIYCRSSVLFDGLPQTPLMRPDFSARIFKYDGQLGRDMVTHPTSTIGYSSISLKKLLVFGYVGRLLNHGFRSTYITLTEMQRTHNGRNENE